MDPEYFSTSWSFYQVFDAAPLENILSVVVVLFEEGTKDRGGGGG
jgi:hypothetical protein